jgi:glutathione S-transferase
VHPLGKSPVVVIEVPGGEKPFVLAETGAIFEYLVDYWGGWLVPQKAAPGNEGKIGKENEAWLRNRYFMHYAEGSLMGLLAVGVVMLSMAPFPLPAILLHRYFW